MRSAAIAAAALAVFSASCSPALEKEKVERPMASALDDAATAGADAAPAAADAATAAANADAAGATSVAGDAGASGASGDDVEQAHGQGACPAWLPASHPAFATVRTKETPAFPRAELGLGEATCCLVTTTDLLCRAPASAQHVVGEMDGTRLLGLRRGVARPWLDVPLEVRSHGSMKSAGLLLVQLDVKVTGNVVALSRRSGVCPRPCSGTTSGCRQAEANATRSCEAVGSYRAGDPQKLP